MGAHNQVTNASSLGSFDAHYNDCFIVLTSVVLLENKSETRKLGVIASRLGYVKISRCSEVGIRQSC